MLETIKSYLHRAYQRQRSFREGRRGTVYTIAHDADSLRLSWLTLENEKGERTLPWCDVVSINASKRDLYAVDLICLAIRLKDGSAVEINEEMSGWDSLVQKLPEYLPRCATWGEWFEAVAFPPFQLNITAIYQRGA